MRRSSKILKFENSKVGVTAQTLSSVFSVPLCETVNIYSSGDGYFPLINTELRVEGDLKRPTDPGFGTDFFGQRGIMHCDEGTVKITVKERGKIIPAPLSQVFLEPKPLPRGRPGVTTNLEEHAPFQRQGEFDGKPLFVITITFNYCDDRPVDEPSYKVTSDPEIGPGPRRK